MSGRLAFYTMIVHMAIMFAKMDVHGYTLNDPFDFNRMNMWAGVVPPPSPTRHRIWNHFYKVKICRQILVLTMVALYCVSRACGFYLHGTDDSDLDSRHSPLSLRDILLAPHQFQGLWPFPSKNKQQQGWGARG